MLFWLDNGFTFENISFWPKKILFFISRAVHLQENLQVFLLFILQFYGDLYILEGLCQNQIVSYLFRLGSDSMKQIIKEVFQAEKKVGEILKQARNKASEIRRSVEKDNSEKMSDAKQEAREIIQTTVEEAKKEAESIRQEKLEQAWQEKDSLLKNKKEAIDNLVEHICNIITKTEYEKDKK